MRHPALALALAALLATAAAPALAQPAPVTAQARLIHQPTVITRPGLYVLARTLHDDSAGPTIDIQASNVTLDLNGYGLVGPGAKSGLGIQAQGVANVRIANGSLRRYGLGVRVAGATNVIVEDLRIDGEDLGGTPPSIEIGVMLANARGVRVERNTITRTFLGIFVRGEGSAGNRVAHNTITGGANGQLGICYNPVPDGDPDGGPHGDLIYANLVSRFATGIAMSEGSTGNLISENSFAFFDAAIVEATAGSNYVAENHLIQITP